MATSSAHQPQQQPYILIGSDHSLYTGKLRAYLTWRGLPFIELTASAELYRQVILPRTGVAFIPVLVLPDHTTVLQDTHAIITHLEDSLFPGHHCQHNPQLNPLVHNYHQQEHPQKQQQWQHPLLGPQQPQQQQQWQQQQCHPMRGPLLPSSPAAAAASMLLELYGDEWMLLPAMHYRWSFPEQRQRLLYQFGSTNLPTGSYEQQMAAGAKVAARFAGMLPGLGISPDSIPCIEARFEWQLDVLQAHFTRHAYLLGSTQPSPGDFGLIAPLLAHLYLDPVPGALIACRAPLVADYIERLGGLHTRARVLDRVLQHGGASVGVVEGAAAAKPQAAAAAAGVGTCDDATSLDSSSSSSSIGSSSGSMVVGLQPQDPEQGKLQLRLLQMQLQPSGHQAPGAPSPQAAAGAAAADGCTGVAGCVPHTALLLLHHMFLEQVPVILSTLRLLHAWITQQQQQQQQQQAGDTTHGASNTSSSTSTSTNSSDSSGGRWLEVPRFLGRHEFALFDPATGQPAVPPSGQGRPHTRAAGSYTAWRAAEIVGWYRQLDGVGQGAVQQLLAAVSAAGSNAAVSTSGSSGAGGAVSAGSSSRGGGSDAAAPAVPQPPQQQQLGAGVAAGAVPPAAAGRVDAAKAFAEMVGLVEACGRIKRCENRVAVWCPGSAASRL